MVRELGSYTEEYFTGSLTQPVITALEGLVRTETVRRLWAIDAGLFTSDVDSAKSIPARMGWLRSPQFMGGHTATLKAWSREMLGRANKALILGVGGVTAGVSALARSVPKQQGGFDLRVLDRVDPDAVREATAWAEPKSTLFVVSSKDGEGLELTSLEAHFYAHVERSLGGAAGSRFVAVSDPGTELMRLARRRRYDRTFENPPDIGARFSMLSFYGLVPAALMGLDLDAFTEDAKRMSDSCSPSVPIEQNPGLRLASFLGGLAKIGRDKITLLLSPEVRPFGAWVQHIVSESTCRRGRGFVVVDGEPVGSTEAYGVDRAFVYLHLASSNRSDSDELVDSLVASGQPVARILINDRNELGGEFFRWEMTAAILASIVRVNPFDDAGLVQSQAAFKRFIDGYGRDGSLPSWPASSPEEEAVKLGVSKLKAGDCLILSAFFELTDARLRTFHEIRRLLRSRFGVATLQGAGTPFVYSTGQLQKQGPAEVMTMLLTSDVKDDVPVPGQRYGFGVLRDAQALAELQLLGHSQRKCLRVHLGGDVDGGLAQLRDALAGI